jgi:hypothetical protein
VDVGFVLDGSGSVRKANWNRMIRFLNTLVTSLPVGPLDANFAALKFATHGKLLRCIASDGAETLYMSLSPACMRALVHAYLHLIELPALYICILVNPEINMASCS